MATNAGATSADGRTVSAWLVKNFGPSADKFVGLADKTFLEIRSFRDEDISITREEKIPTDQIQSWLDLKAPVGLETGETPPSTVLRLMVSPFNENTMDYLPISPAKFASTFKFLGLKDSYLHDEKLQGLSSWFNLPLEDNLMGIIVKTELYDHDVASFSLALFADLSSGRTSGVLHVLLKTDLKRVKDYLIEDHKQYSCNLMTLPLLLAQIRISSASGQIPDQLERILVRIYETEKKIGFIANSKLKRKYTHWGYYARDENVRKREEFDIAGRELTSVVLDCVMLECKAQLYIRLLNWIEEMYGKVLTKTLDQGRSGSLLRSESLLSEKIKILKGSLENCKIRSQHFGQRARAQAQAYAGIMSRRDNASSLKVSQVMLRDSSDMRAIFLVTMCFVLGIFMARLSSAGFFDFHQESYVVSHYWVFTGCLAGIALALFAIWNWNTRRRPVE